MVYVNGGTPVANLLIQNSIIGENSYSSVFNLQVSTTNLKVSNNIIFGGSGAVFQNVTAATFENNLILSVGTGIGFHSVSNCDIKNNIFIGVNICYPGGISNNTLRNNLSYNAYGQIFPTADGNISTGNILDQNPLFNNFTAGSLFSFSYDLTLQAASPAKGTGVDGTDIGVFGGLNPFDIHGTSLPVIKTITAPNTVTQGTNMNVRIEAKGN
jgi:hypothetical protein